MLLIQTLESSSCGKVQGALPEKWTRLQKGLEKAEIWLKVLLICSHFSKIMKISKWSKAQVTQPKPCFKSEIFLQLALGFAVFGWISGNDEKNAKEAAEMKKRYNNKRTRE